MKYHYLDKPKTLFAYNLVFLQHNYLAYTIVIKFALPRYEDESTLKTIYKLGSGGTCL